MNHTIQLLLASTSPYRKILLEKLRLPFSTVSPNIDENPLAQESPEQLVARLAKAKALAVAPHNPNSLIIGSDQVAVVDGQVLGKPQTHEKATQQLKRASGKRITLLTGLCLHSTVNHKSQVEVIPFSVVMRHLTETQIENYLRQEQPYDCAGSFKAEGLGIALFESLEGNDPNALIGLPLIRLVRMLEKAGMPVI
ncbi:MAG: septum formation inhibitor Maf [Gammaproteobacteria bacterium]|nr:septum formation inhibitor Maf [Gammaproteobacteria bacterium]